MIALRSGGAHFDKPFIDLMQPSALDDCQFFGAAQHQFPGHGADPGGILGYTATPEWISGHAFLELETCRSCSAGQSSIIQRVMKFLDLGRAW